MQGNLILNADPTANLGAATKQYVDNNKVTANLFKKRLAFQETKNAQPSDAVQYGTIPTINIGETGALFSLKCNSLNINASGTVYFFINLQLNSTTICRASLSSGKVYNQELPFVLFFYNTYFYSSDRIGIVFTGVNSSFDAGEQSIGLSFSYSAQLTVSGTITLSVYYF